MKYLLVALDSSPIASEEVTDLYLADLAAKHGCRLVTMDKGISHASVGEGSALHFSI